MTRSRPAAAVKKDGTERTIIGEMLEAIGRFGSIIVSGEEGVGKITNTLEALRDTPNVYYVGNPVDYVGKPRPKGYDKYIQYITNLKKDMRIIASDKEILSFDFTTLAGQNAVVIVDEIFGRSIAEYEKIRSILSVRNLKVVLITGCLKNVGKMAQEIEAVVMLTTDGVLLVDRDFVLKMCKILRAEPLQEQLEL